MAITRPVTRTTITTAAWGIPITDEVNRLTANQIRPRVVAGKWINQPVSADLSGNVAIPNLTATFVARANTVYEFVISTNVISGTGGAIAYLTPTANAGVNNIGIFVDALTFSTQSPNWGHPLLAKGWLCSALGTAAPANATVTIGGNVNSPSPGFKINSATNFIVVLEVGPDTGYVPS